MRVALQEGCRNIAETLVLMNTGGTKTARRNSPDDAEDDRIHRILFIRRIVQIWYTRIGDKEGAWRATIGHSGMTYVCTEKHLVTLRKQQKEKIEEIKKKTNYDTTRNLIERYDDALDSPLRRRIPAPSQPVTPQARLATPQSKVQTPQTQTQRLSVTPAQVPPALRQQLSRAFPVCSTTVRFISPLRLR